MSNVVWRLTFGHTVEWHDPKIEKIRKTFDEVSCAFRRVLSIVSSENLSIQLRELSGKWPGIIIEARSAQCFSHLMTPAALLFEVCPSLIRATEFLYGSPMRRVAELNAVIKGVIREVLGIPTRRRVLCVPGDSRDRGELRRERGARVVLCGVRARAQTAGEGRRGSR